MTMYGISDELIALVRAMCNNLEYAVLEEGETKVWFQVQSGVKQWRVMSGFLFVPQSTGSSGIRWKFTSVKGNLDFADDITSLSS